MAMKTPLNVALCICVLASGIALATSTYRFYEMVFATTVPYLNSDRMAAMSRVSAKNNKSDWPIQTYRAFAEKQHVYETMLPYVPVGLTIRGDSLDMQVQGTFIDTEAFRVLGVRPELGRGFTADDAKPDSPRVCVISHTLWQTMFSRDLDVIGKSITINGTARIVVGVMTPDFDGPFPLIACETWMPLNMDTVTAETGWARSVSALCVVKPGIPRSETVLQADVTAKAAMAAYPHENENMAGAKLRFINDMHAAGSVRNILFAVFACTFLILLMSCGIVSGLLTARYSTRTQEIAIRTALGASRWQIVGQMVMEFMTVSCPSVVLGLLLSRWFDLWVLEPFYNRFHIPPFMRRHDSLKMTVFIVAVLCFVTFVSTIMPTLRASRTNLDSILRESTRTASSLRVTRLTNFLVAWQVASACVVLSGGAMIGHFIYAYNHFNSTFDPGEYIAFRIAFNASDHADRAAKCNEAMRLVQLVRNTPGVEKACMTNELSAENQWSAFGGSVWIEGKEYASSGDAPDAFSRLVVPGYMDALNIPILRGRDFTPEDDEKRPVAIVSEGFARQHYGSLDVIGKRFKTSRDGAFMTIVGVVPEVFNPDGDENAYYGYFRPYAAEPWNDMYLYVKGRGSFEDIRKSVTRTINGLDSKICVPQVLPYSEARNSVGPFTFMAFLMTLFSTFSVCALLMTVGGLYGVISFVTNMRKPEMGIRMALGAMPMGLVMLMTRKGLVFVVVGLILGAAGFLFLQNATAHLFGGAGNETLIYLGAAVILMLISALSIFIPAYRAARCEPAKILRD
jgi:putative ABC transport system permease protein